MGVAEKEGSDSECPADYCGIRDREFGITESCASLIIQIFHRVRWKKPSEVLRKMNVLTYLVDMNQTKIWLKHMMKNQ